MENELVFFETKDEQVKLNIKLSEDNVWLTRNQMAELFDRDVKTIGKHIGNALKEELDDSVVANFATTAADGKNYKTEHYNLDMVISVGYRVKSRRGVEFRRWANSVLKDYILKGYAVNNNRISQLNEVVRIMKRTDNMLDVKQVLSVVEQFTVALDLLDDYDYQRISKPKGNNSTYVLTYKECKEVIANMKFNADSDLFGNEKDDSFTDGNKRIAATMFLYFLEKNGMLIIDGEKIIEDYTLVAITILIAESKPDEKETMVKLVMNFLNR